MKTRSEASSDPLVHTQNVQQMLTDLIDHLREDLDKIEEAKAQALFETSAEVLTGLRTHSSITSAGARRECGQVRRGADRFTGSLPQAISLRWDACFAVRVAVLLLASRSIVT